VVNRFLVMAARSSSQAELERIDRGEADLGGAVVYDPFCGSGGALLEAAKLGAQVIGRDINPVAALATRQALQHWDVRELQRGFDLISQSCGAELTDLYVDGEGRVVRGYFWVATAVCGVCDERVDLFHRHVFARHAYPKKHPAAHGVCRACGEVAKVDLSVDDAISCPSCAAVTPFRGSVRSGAGTSGTQFQCGAGHTTRVASSAKVAPIGFRMYAKLIEENGKRVYARTTEADDDAYERTSARLRQLGSGIVQPCGSLERGKNTDQVLRVGLKEWRDFYNDRQLLALGLIATAIRDLEVGEAEREALAAAFSKSVEFNNMLSSFKGEGTGAVRSAFHNHTLQFERMPFEANLWSAASGGFHASYQRLHKALDHKAAPTDLRITGDKPERIIGCSAPVLLRVMDSPQFGPGLASVTCGDSGHTEIADASVDIVLTDPPHFDKVNYSELADFFHAWLTQIRPFTGYPQAETTRSALDVQNESSATFEDGLTRVWKDVARALKADGIVVFSFHHRDAQGWKACMNSLRAAGLCVTFLQMVRAEMTTSLSKKNQSSPHSMDVLVVCRKQQAAEPLAFDIEGAVNHARGRIRSLARGGVEPLPGDARSIMLASVLSLRTNTEVGVDVDGLVDAASRHARQAEQRLANRSRSVERAA
jgi:adenine-specific DNA methylase